MALYSEGKILFAVEEERFNREKHTRKFPLHSLDYITNKFSLDKEKNVLTVFFMNPWLSFWAPFKMFFQYLTLKSFTYGFKKARKRLNEWFYLKKWSNAKGWKAIWVNHHQAHAACSFFLSPFQNATIVTIDGRGEYLSVGFFRGENKTIKSLGGISIPFSVGYFYSYLTEFLGFKAQSDEYKVMGLSAFGKPIYLDILSSIFNYEVNKRTFVDLRVCDFWKTKGKNTFDNLTKLLGPNRKKGESISSVHVDIATSLQVLTQRIISKIVSEAIKRAGYKNVCLSGGVGLNCVANSYVAQLNEVENLFIPPAPNDSGTSLGAALMIANRLCLKFKGKPDWDPFLGNEYSSDEIKLDISRYTNDIEFEILENPSLTAASLLSKEKIIGWFQGKMEWGPRALGNRSILSPAYPISIKDKLNTLIKERETFRPFAPMILEEYLLDYFEVENSVHSILNFMLCIGKAREIACKNIPAALNVDGSARIQTINSKFNEKCWDLLNYYRGFTGIPAIINTSFNIKGNPIVSSPSDAIADFLDSKLDFIIIQNYLIKRKHHV
ncbi:MAG: hypothetical protein K8I03_00980 [Ignavibacteria bacterium]|nr:hypothetical protein [Ignavibacteria bacterium]